MRIAQQNNSPNNGLMKPLLGELNYCNIFTDTVNAELLNR